MPKHNTENVQVFLRLRPMNEAELRERCSSCVSVDNDRKVVDYSVGSIKQAFSFEKVFDEDANQAHVYEHVASPLVSEFLSGRDCCLIAYGEAGSGKTHTMFGHTKAVSEGSGDDDENDGGYDEEESCISSLGSSGASEARSRRSSGPTTTVPPPSRVYMTAKTSYHPPLHPTMTVSSRAQVPSQLLTPQQKMLTATTGGGRHGRKPDGFIGTTDVLGGNNRNFGGGDNKVKSMRDSSFVGDRTPKLLEEAGVFPRIVHDIFSSLSKQRIGNQREKGAGGEAGLDVDCSVMGSCVAVYFENLIDLLADQGESETAHSGTRGQSRMPSLKSLSLKEDPKTGSIFIGGDVEHPCSNEDDAIMLLERGNAFRMSTETRMNIDLSRSHTIFTIALKQRAVISRLYLVDLAGNEPLTKRASKSLAALENVVYALSESHDAYVPYRDSTLTRVLKNALGGNSVTRLIITASPSSHIENDTLSALRFGQRAKRIVNKTIERDGDEDGGMKGRKEHTSHRKDFVGVTVQNQSEGKITDCVVGSTQVRSVDGIETCRKKVSTCTGEDGSSRGSWDADKNAKTALASLRSSPGRRQTSDVDEASSVQGAAKQMEGDLALAREELTTVSSLLHSAAKRMDADLSMARKEPVTLAPHGKTADQLEADLQAAKKELSLRQNASSQQPLHLTARQIELDLEAARRELMGMASDLGDDKKENGTVGTADVTSTADLTGLVSDGPNPDAKALTSAAMAERKKKDQLLAAMEKEISALRKENDVLNRAKNNREEELNRAKKDIKVLTLRATDAENSLKNVLNRQGGKSNEASNRFTTANTGGSLQEENKDVSNIVGSQTQSNYSLKGRSSLTDVEAAAGNIDTLPDGLNIRVCLRLRPMSKLETSRRSRSCVEIHEGSRNFTVDSHLDGEYDFCYDQIFGTDAAQSTVYDEIGRHAVSDLLSGINCAIMAYGLSSSGKTFTLMGTFPDTSPRDSGSRESSQEDMVEDEAAGIAPRLIRDLFKGMEGCAAETEFSIRCSFVSIYLEKIFDLLQPHAKKTLYVGEDAKGIKIEGATEALCFDKSDIFALLQRGKACQSVLATRMNTDTNRSHSVFIIRVEQCNIKTGTTKNAYMLFADLAGFEISAKPKGQTIQETKIAHKSFSALGNVIKALTENNPHAPYRESKLTCVLKDALGGNCKSTLIITASPSSYTISETINTIRLGQRVRRIVNMPRVNWEVNIEDYKRWLMATEIKFGELVAFVKELAVELRRGRDGDSANALKCLSGEVWESINAIVDEEEKLHNPCRQALSLGDMEALKGCSAKWKALSVEVLKRIPSEELSAVKKSRDSLKSLLQDIQSEVVVLRRQNELLVHDKKKKVEELASVKQDMKLLMLRIAELEHNLGLSEYRSNQAMTFLQHLRSLCWSLRKDVSTGRTLAIAEVTSCISGTPDLSGLVDLDSLMLETGLIETLDLNDDDDDLPTGSSLKECSDRNAAHGGSGRPAPQSSEKMEADDERIDDVDDKKLNPVMRQNLFKSTGNLVTNLMGNSAMDQDENTGETAPAQFPEGESPAERELRKDLRNMANKCIELQMLLNEEKANVNILTNRSRSLKSKQLAQEVISLRKEKDSMMHNAKAATWKLHELHVVNKILAKKSSESSQHITFLEEGFQRLQETFRTTVLDSLDADSQLRERVASLEAVVDSLTVPQNQSVELDAISRPVPRMNVQVHGQLEWSKEDAEPDANSQNTQGRCLMLVPSLKVREKTPSFIVRRQSKHHRRSKKMGYAPSRPVALKGGLKSANWKEQHPTVPPKFEGNLYPFPYLGQAP